VKKEYLYKNIVTNLHKCYTVTLIDESQLVSEKERMKVFKGEVPEVEIISQKISNKKQTTITGLDLYHIDYDEFCSFLQHKCASSVSMNEIEHLSTVKSPKYLIKIQGS
jgi:translation initiation factor 1 (eIF-1/SUI1)